MVITKTEVFYIPLLESLKAKLNNSLIFDEVWGFSMLYAYVWVEGGGYLLIVLLLPKKAWGWDLGDILGSLPLPVYKFLICTGY